MGSKGFNDLHEKEKKNRSTGLEIFKITKKGLLKLLKK